MPKKVGIYFGYKLYLDCDLGWVDVVGMNAFKKPSRNLQEKYFQGLDRKVTSIGSYLGLL